MPYDLPQITVISQQFCHAESEMYFTCCPTPHRREEDYYADVRPCQRDRHTI
jgi:hypothetical protein